MALFKIQNRKAIKILSKQFREKNLQQLFEENLEEF